jgi:hypothetical protein
MEIIIEGWRAGSGERKEAANVPIDQLPPLSEAQKKVAQKLGISEEAYARSAYAGARNQERLLAKTKRFGEILEAMLHSKFAGARVGRIRLVTIDHEYQVELDAGRQILFRVPEEMVDDFVEGGSAEVGRTIERNLETVLNGRAA